MLPNNIHALYCQGFLFWFLFWNLGIMILGDYDFVLHFVFKYHKLVVLGSDKMCGRSLITINEGPFLLPTGDGGRSLGYLPNDADWTFFKMKQRTCIEAQV